MNTIQAKCNKCVLTESSAIHIDINGNCCICNSEERYKHIYKEPDLEKLEIKICEIKKKGKSSEYDCVVSWSGGRDSTSLLYELTKTHKLRCDAIFFKTPFTPIEIVENVRAISKKLGVRLIERETPKNHLEVATFCTELYAETKLPIMINLACSPCKFLNREIFKITRNMRIKSIIYGGNQYEYIPASPAAIDIKSDDRYSTWSMIKDNAIRVKKGFKILISSPQLFKYIFSFFGASVLYVNPYSSYFKFESPLKRDIL